MSSKNNASSGAAATTRLSNGTVLSYSLGDVANNLSFMMTSMFLMAFMTDIAGIGAGVAGAIYAATKVWAGITDLTAGQTVDRFDTRWGRLRPWILFGSGPLVIVFIALFSLPAGFSPNQAIVWILLFDALYQLGYSFVNIPYGSLSAAMTQDPVDRSRLSGARAIASAAASVLLAFVVAPQFSDTTADNIRMKFTIMTAILGVVAFVLYLICFKNTRETVERPKTAVTLRATMAMLRQNRPLLILCLGAFFLLCSMFTMSAVSLYYARDVLGNAGWYAYLMLAQTIGSILVASFVPAITSRFGKRNGYVMAAGIVILAFVIIFFAPGGALIAGLLGWFAYGVGTGGTNALMFSMQADCVDYGEWKSGVRSEGGSYSILSFIRKCGQGLGGGIGGAIIAYFGYAPDVMEQTERAIQGIRVATGAAPAILAVVALVVMLAYPLDIPTHTKIVRELNERRTGAVLAEQTGMADVASADVGDGRTTVMRRAGEATPPIITVFGESGAGASVIAPMLAKELGVKYVGQRFSSKELASVDRSALISDSGFDRWLRSVDTGATGSTAVVGAGGEQNHRVAMENTRNVLAQVENGGVVLGRNGAFVLHHVVGAMHVRLIAPKPKRIERISHRTGLPLDKAQSQLEAEDRLRNEMSIHLYQWSPNNDNYYDLIINTGSVTYEQVVELIVDLYRSKYPDNKPLPGVEVPEIVIPDMPQGGDRKEGGERDVRD